MSLNDPQWGRRPGGNQGPPDLDELWRNFNRKLDGLFGRRGGGGDGGGAPARRPRRIGGGAGLLAGTRRRGVARERLLHRLEGQRGVVLRFGKYRRDDAAGSALAPAVSRSRSAEVVNLLGVRTVEVGYRNNVKSKVLEGIADADRRREHRRRAVRRAVHR